MFFEPVTENHEQVLIIGGGESLSDFNFDIIKNLDVAIITVNNVIHYLPRTDYWITVDPIQNDGKPQVGMTDQYNGTKYFCCIPDIDTIQSEHDRNYYRRAMIPGVHLLERILPADDNYKFQEEKNKITTGDSIFGAMGLAYHFGAKRIALLGVDVYGSGHWYDKSSPYNGYNQEVEKWEAYRRNVRRIYSHCVDQFVESGVQVFNGSPDSFVDCFPRMTPIQAIDKLIKII